MPKYGKFVARLQNDWQENKTYRFVNCQLLIVNCLCKCPINYFPASFGTFSKKITKETVYQMLWGRKHNKPFRKILFPGNFY